MTAVETWAPPATALVVPTVFPDEFFVQVFSTVGGPTLVASIEFVSPGIRQSSRHAPRL